MKSRRYGQFCALVAALDVVGERWTLLIIRELLIGPRRFTDLLEGLPGISTNLLADRLKSLEQQGVLQRRTLPRPAGSTVYALTPIGFALEKAVVEMGRWGAQFLPTSLDGVALPSAGSMALAIKAFFHPERAADIDETYELHLGDEILQIRVQGGELLVRQGQPFTVNAIFYTDVDSYLGLFTRQLEPETAVAAGLIRIEGDPQALRRFVELSSLPHLPQ